MLAVLAELHSEDDFVVHGHQLSLRDAGVSESLARLNLNLTTGLLQVNAPPVRQRAIPESMQEAGRPNFPLNVEDVRLEIRSRLSRRIVGRLASTNNSTSDH